MPIGLALVLATSMAVVTLIFHLIHGSSLLTLALRIVVVWFGIVVLVGFWSFCLRRIFGESIIAEEMPFDRQGRLDLVSNPENDRGIEDLLYK